MPRYLHATGLVASILCYSLAALSQPSAQANLQEDYQLRVHRTNDAMEIDGHLREKAWREAEPAGDFWMSFPVDDRRAAAETQTEVRLAYDDQYLYIGVVCHDQDQYVIPTLKRDSPDFWQGDAFAVVIDPVNERTNGFSFGVSPANVQIESLITGQTGRRIDQLSGQSSRGINDAWDNKWYSAVQTYPDQWIIEMAIPFKSLRFSAEKKTWGINFVRGEPGTNSFHTWTPVPVQLRGEDLGYTGALIWDDAPRRVKRNVAVIPYVLGSGNRDFEEDQPTQLDFQAGADAKVAITSSLNLDVTINPDFSQVEVDQQVANLTRFNIRFPERRLFFLENSDLFEDFGIPPMRPFFSRRIGLDLEGNTIPIQYGLRLSGNLNQDLRLGLMNMKTGETDLQAGQNYTSLALHQRVMKRSVIKGYFHNRQAVNHNETNEDRFNRTGGMEFSYQSPDGRWRGFGGGGLSFTDGLSGENYFYNVGGGYDGRNLSFYSNLAGVGDNYVVDMGFVPSQEHYDALQDTTHRVGYHHQYSRIGYTIYPQNHPRVISHQVGLRSITDVRTNWDFIGNNLELEYNLRWQNTGSFRAAGTHEDLNLLFPFAFTDGEPLPAGRYRFDYFEISYLTDQRKPFRLEAGFQYGSFYNGKRTQYTLGLKYRAQPWGNFDLNFVVNNLDFPDIYGDEDLFLISPRVEINFSTNLFWTTFLQYNTQQDNFNINSRLQWRFQPMSDLFIVYADNYAVEFWGPKNRTVVLKLNYWLNL